jgi:aminoglycoside phosphotransferase family enzyme/predicted kinase
MKPSLQTQSRLVDNLRKVLHELHGGTVHIVQTHLSWVLLAGDFAYKIKKSLRFAFADFSTLESREENCRREVQLNRRFAPELYIDVIRICGSTDHPTLNGDTSTIEYAVKLRRFDQSAELASMLKAGVVDSDDFLRFGASLAQIHEASVICGDSETAQDARLTAMNNVDELGRFAKSVEMGSHTQWLGTEWQLIAQAVARRGREGRVRECHGDLHVGNILRWRDELVAFDCIEFNASLSCIDVASDVAFLFMDLLAHERRDLAYSFLNGWLESGGDYAAVQLLRFFAVHRALVRSKVAALEHNAEKVDRYVKLASDLQKAREPKLTITCGLSGSGKTWLSGELIKTPGVLRVRSDVERKRLAGLKAHESSQDRGLDIYSTSFNRQVYEQLRNLARIALRAGEHIIVDAAFLRSEERFEFMRLAHEERASFHILHCEAPDAELRERLRNRQAHARDASEADERVLQQQRGYWEPFEKAELAHVLHVQTNEKDAVAQIAREVSAPKSLGS